MLKTEEFVSLIGQYDKIAVIRHLRPDYDALGSQWALIRFIRKRWPRKLILAAGEHESLDPSFLGDPEPLPADWDHYLCIVADTSTRKRADGLEVYLKADERIIFDHHHGNDFDHTHAIVNTEASSCCEILCEFFREINEGRPLEHETAEALYAGLISDTLRFSISTTTVKTLEDAAYLLQSGLDINRINNVVFALDLDMYRYCNFLRETANYDTEHLVYAVLKREDYLERNIPAEQAKSQVSIFGSVKGVEVWALIVQDENSPTYNASLRAHRIKIRDIAERFGGGGHDCAAGISGLSPDQVRIVIDLLKEKVTTNF